MWPPPWYTAGPYRRRSSVRRRRFPLRLEALEDRTLLSAGSSFANAPPIILDTSGSGTQSGTLAAGQADYYQFQATYTGELTIRQSADPSTNSKLDSLLSVFDGSSPQPQLLASNDDLPDQGTLQTDNNGNITPNLDSLVHVAVIAGQTYYVEAAVSPGAAPGQDAGDYLLTFGSHDGGTSFADAAPTQLDATNAGMPTTGTIAVSGDVDLYQFTAQATGGVTIEQDAANDSGLDTTLVVFDATGRQIAYNDDIDTKAGNYNSRVQLAVDAGQTYYVEAAASPYPSGSDTGDYQLTITPVADHVPNTLADAQPITLDAQGAATQPGSIDYRGDVDAFQFQATVTGRITIQQQAASGSSLDSFLTAYDAAGRPITFNDDNGPTGHDFDSRVSFDVVAGQTYFVRAGASPAAGTDGLTGAYQLTFQTAARAAPADPGHVFADPVALTPDGFGEVRRLGTIAAPGQNDVFQITAAQSGPLVVREEALAGGTALHALLYVFDGGGRLLGFSFDTGGHRSFFVYHHAGPGDAGLYDYHDNSAEQLPNSDEATDFDFAQVQFDAAAGQTYYFVATGFEEGVGQYALTVLPTDQGNLLSDAQPLPVDATGAGNAFGTIGVPSGRQMYAFTAPVTGRVIVQENATSSSPLDPVLTAYDAAGNQIAFNDDANPNSKPPDLNSLVGFKVIAGQTYYLAAAGYGMTTGSYRLLVNPAIPDGFGTDFASATDLTATLGPDGSGSVSGTIIVPGGADYFQFTAPVSGGLTIGEAAAPGSPVDAYLTLYGSDQRLLTYNDDGGGSTDSLLRFNVTQGETYYVEAGVYGDSLGAYVLTFTGGPTIADGFGHTFDDAQAIPLDAAGAGAVNGDIVNPADQDFFQFTAPADGLVSLTQDAAAGSPLDSVLTVFDATPQHGQVAFSDDVNPPRDLDSGTEFLVSGGQTYYVLAAGYGTSTGAYRVTISPVAPDGYGTDFASATDVTSSLSADGSGSVAGAITTSGETDFLLFTAPASGALTIEQDAALGSPLDSMLTVYDGSQRQLAQNDDIGDGTLNSRVQVTVTAGQTYYVEAAASAVAVSNASGSEVGSYTLTLSMPSAAAAGGSQAPGGAFATATPVTFPASGPTTVSGAIASPGDVHYYRFTAPAAGELTAEQDAAPGSLLDSYLYVYDGAGNQIASDDDSAGNLNSLAEFPVAAGQTYFVESAAFGDSTGAYTLTLATADSRLRHTFADALDLLAAGSDPASGAAAGFADATGDIAAPGDVNFFQFTAPFTGGMEIRQQALPGSGLQSYLFAYDGTAQHNLLASDGGHGADSAIRLAIQQGQTYVVEAAGDGASTGAYALSLAAVPDDFGNDFTQAEPLQLDATDAGTQAGGIEVPGDTDVFRFVAPASGLLTVALAPADASLFPVLAAYDTSQQPIALQADTDRTAHAVQVQFAVDAGQTYYVEASGFGAHTGDYVLSFHDPVGVAAAGPRDFASARPLTGTGTLSFDSQGTATVPVQGSLDPGESQFFRFQAEQAGQLAVAVTGGHADVDVFTFPNGFQAPAVQVAGGVQNTFPVNANQTYYVRVTSRETVLPGPGGYALTFTQVAASGATVDPRAGGVTADDLRHAFSVRIRSDADPQQTADAISASLVQTFVAGLGGHVTGDYLLLWLDPVDFVVTDPRGRQAGNTPDRVEVNEVPGSFYSDGGDANVLQLLILPNALASQYALNLIGVGDQQVLAGARLITPSGAFSPTTSLVFTTQPGSTLERVLDFSPQTPALVTAPGQDTAVAQAAPAPGPSVAAAPAASPPTPFQNAVAAMLLNATVTTVTAPVTVTLPPSSSGKAAAPSPTGGSPVPGPVGQSGTSTEGGGGLAGLLAVVDRVFSGPILYAAAQVSAEVPALAVPGTGVAEGIAGAVGAALAPVQEATRPVREVVFRLADGMLAPAVAEVKFLAGVLRARRMAGRPRVPARPGKATLPAGQAAPPDGKGGVLSQSLAPVVFLAGAWYARPADEERKKTNHGSRG
jgi:hypothetical protein